MSGVPSGGGGHTGPRASASHAASETQHLPFFVYGTLMAGAGFKNHESVVRGRHISATRARLPAHAVFHYSAGWPGMYAAADDAVVIGQLLTFSAADFPSVLREMDALEGAASVAAERCCPRSDARRMRNILTTCLTGGSPRAPSSSADYYGRGDARNHYERVAREVLVDSADGTPTTVLAWTYMSLLDKEGMRAEAVPGGDWRAFMADRPHLTDAADDWRARLGGQ